MARNPETKEWMEFAQRDLDSARYLKGMVSMPVEFVENILNEEHQAGENTR